MIRSIAALLCALMVVGISGAIEISGPAEITAPGEYRLTADVAGGGITVCSGDVVLDGTGHRFVGSPGEGARGVLVAGPVTNVTVRNLSLAGWEVGIEVCDTAGVRLERVFADNCTANGIYIERCQEVVVRDCVASGNALPGVAVNATRGCRMLGTAATGNADVGFYVVGSRMVAIEGCNASANGLNGIFLEKSEGVRVAGCRLEGNGYPGIAAANTGGLAIVDNLASMNRLSAVWLERSERTVVTRNVATGSEVGLIVRNASAPPFAGGNLFLTARPIDGGTRTLPSLGPWVRHTPSPAPAS